MSTLAPSLASLLAERPLIRQVVCPNCWHQFSVDDTLWIAVHKSLADESQLPQHVSGEFEQRRFIPERFDVYGRALDAENAACSQLACPRCRLEIPRASVELPSLGISVLGSPGSGKSVFLASSTFEFRQTAARLGLNFQDAELSLNRFLIDDERKMFLGEEAASFRPIQAAVQKTQLNDQRYRTSRIDGHDASFVAPYTFLLRPSPEHPHAAEARALARLLCIYDNAGEHFLPGLNPADRPMTQHLAASKGLIFVFDPTQEARVRRRLSQTIEASPQQYRQDSVLIEAANQIRVQTSVPQDQPIAQHLVIALTKADVWHTLLTDFRGSAWLAPDGPGPAWTLQLNIVEAVSKACRNFLATNCPEFVTAVESVSKSVTFVPVAAVGWDIRVDQATQLSNFHAADCKPFGVIVPLLILLSKIHPRLVPSTPPTA